MPFDITGLRLSGYGAPNVTIAAGTAQPFIQEWDYATGDTAAVVEAANYFNPAAANFRKGDSILSRMVLGGTPILKRYIVTSATAAATVTVALQTTAAG
jgi:hypothetical protein